MEEYCANIIKTGGDCDAENVQSEEDDEIDRRRPRKKLLFDSDDEEGEGGSPSSVSRVSMEIPSGDADNENVDTFENESSDKENDETQAAKFVSTKTRRKIKVVSDSDSDEESIANTQRDVDVEPSELHNKFDVLKERKNKWDISESTTSASCNAAKNLYANSDLFDAEKSSSDEDSEKEKTADDGEESDEISLNDIKKKAKDALTKADRKSASGRRKPKKNDLKQLHSDSQRLLREGRVNLPYHVPQKKSLEDFLNRKKWTPNALRPRAHEIEHTLENMNKFIQENKAKLSNMDQINPVMKPVQEENVVPGNCDGEVVDMTEEEGESLLKLETERVLDDLCDNVSRIVDAEMTAPTDPSHNVEIAKNSDDCLSSLSKIRRALLEKRLTECTPKLGGQCNSSVICLDDDDDDDEPEVSEFNEFLNRFVEHRAATTKTFVPPHQVELKILKKENDSAGETVLSTEKLIVTLKGDENPNGDAIEPGASRRLLKKNLEVQMAQRRAQLRQKLSQVDLLDNEEGFEGEESKTREFGTESIDGNVETESEVDTEDETEDSEEDTESDIEEDVIERKRSKNVFVDDEAEEEDGNAEDEECEEDENLENGENEEENLDNPIKQEAKFDLGFGPSQPPKSQHVDIKKPEDVSLDTSIELIGSLIPANQPFSEREFYEKDAEEQVDNSEDIFSQTLHDISPTNRENTVKAQRSLLSQFDFGSQSLSTCSKLGERSMLIDEEPHSTQEGIDELALLCSGKWTAPSTNQLVANDIQDLYGSPMSSLDNMNELEGLCSGKFTKGMNGAVATGNDESQELINTNRSSIDSQPDFSLDDELSISSLTSDIVRPRKVKRVLSESEGEGDDLNDHDSGDESQSGGSDVEDDSVPKNRISRFLDDEAELSGSDIPSDDEDDVEDKDDVLLEELGDMEHYSEDELRDQDGKVHMKWMLDEDQRKLRHVKELYLENGDLHIDGQKRLRKFRWRNQWSSNDDNVRIETQSETEEYDEGEDQELRKCRNERELWLNEEHRKLTIDKRDEEMTFPSLAKKVQLLNRGDSVKILESTEIAEKSQSGKRQFKAILCSGSFLSKNGKRLSKIADMTRSATDGSSGTSNSRNFVFAARTPPKEQNPKMRRIATVTSSSLNLVSKRHCLKAPDFATNNSHISVFNLL